MRLVTLFRNCGLELMTKILAIDASTERCSVALLQNGQVLEKVNDTPRAHAGCLLPMVDEVLAEGGCGLQQLSAIAFGAGPGSFTGLRICLGVVQGLSFGANLPVIGISSLEAMAYAAHKRYPQFDYLMPAIDARMNEVYWAGYKVSEGKLELFQSPQATSVAEVDNHLATWLKGKEVVGIGSGWGLLMESRDLLTEMNPRFWPQAAAVASLAHDAYDAGDYTDAMAAEPIYLRTEISWKKRQRIRR